MKTSTNVKTIDIRAPNKEVSTQQGEPTALEAVGRLFHALQRQNVRYCHWKSNLRLEKGLRGQTDMDLLVDRQHSQLFMRILSEHDVKPVLPAPGREYPDIENYLGLDPVSGKLFHLHVHYQLVLGEQFVKNYHLPLEAQFLDDIRLCSGVNIPVPELEIIVLSIRALLKYRDRDVLKDVLSIGSPGLPAHIREEIQWLLGQTTIERVAEKLLSLGEVIPGEIILEFLRTVTENPRNGYRFFWLRRRIRLALGSFQRKNRFRAVQMYFGEVWRRRTFLRFSPNRKMTLPSGGITIALVGVDGAGKSTMAKMLAKWLSWKLDSAVYYLGSKRPSWRSDWLYLLFRMARRGHRFISRALGEKNALTRGVVSLRQFLLYSHYLSIGYDRYQSHLQGWKRAKTGSVIFYDRYPLEASLDGPKISQSIDGSAGVLARALSGVEQGLYRRFIPPDFFCVLDVSPEVSLRRKPDHNRSAIESKNLVVGSLMTRSGRNGEDSRRIHINADLPMEDVLRQLKAKIWQVL